MSMQVIDMDSHRRRLVIRLREILRELYDLVKELFLGPLKGDFR
jgi:hypothetical protein